MEAATPDGRDRTVDALRALAIAGVILGHWLVTALVLTPSAGGDRLQDSSPLASVPDLAPASWIFQTLAIFFFVGGYAAARSRKGQYLPWLRRRLARLGRPVLVLAAFWVPLTAGMILAGVRAATIHTLVLLVLSPLWFLCVFAGLTALTPLAVALVRRGGAAAALVPAALVAGVDAARFALGGPAWLGWVNVLAGWMVPYLLGIAWARGSFRGWKVPAVLLGAGAAGTAALITWAGYPASMVGVNGARISNLNPPTLAAVTFGVAQVGLALLLRPWLARLMRRPLAWAAVALANLSAMTLFLWHQSAFLAVTMTGSLAGRLRDCSRRRPVPCGSPSGSPGCPSSPSPWPWPGLRFTAPSTPAPGAPAPGAPMPGAPVPGAPTRPGTRRRTARPAWTARCLAGPSSGPARHRAR